MLPANKGRMLPLKSCLTAPYGRAAVLRPGLTGGQATGTEVNNSLLQINLPQTAATIRSAVASGRSALAQLNSQGLQVRSISESYELHMRQRAEGGKQ